MSDINDLSPTPETPWEFIPDDDIRDELAAEELPPAEADAMHVETAPPRLDPDVDIRTDKPIASDEVVHYFPDEHPEVPDTSEPPDTSADQTPEVEELLIRQHYLPADEPDEPDEPDQPESD